ncbi:MAG TPA: hypothetical protein PK466_10340 [Thermotogota bacterium]|nr:hypothetical protein [Thermotogota bacterium]HPJ88571.1 hypothetical protein [Thermotogota bacterium]HPR96722.1 hypothetical protein [Thermotogota bacterium]
MWRVSKGKTGYSFPELLTGIIIVVMISIPVYSFVDSFCTENAVTQMESLLTKIEMDIAFSSSEALRCLSEKKIVYNKGDCFYGFKFVDVLLLEINHYGQLEQGDSAVVEKNGQQYMLKVKPVSAAVTLEQIQKSD